MAKGIVNILTDKIFPTTTPAGNQTKNHSLKSLLFSPPISRGDADAALNHITGKFIERQTRASRNVAVKKSGDGDEPPQKTVVDFYKKVLEEQPFDHESLSKKKVSVVLNAKKPAAQMTLADYDMAKDRAFFKEAGYAMLTDEEIKMAVSAIKAHGSVNHSGETLDKLRRIDNQPGWMFVTTDKASIEYAKRAAQAVLQFQNYKAGQLDAGIEKGRNYATDALGGFVQPIVNAPVNIVNGVSEPFRAAERISFGTKYIPEIPRMQIAERSEYWNKDGRMVINTGAEITSTILLGGAAGGKAIGTQAGRIFLGGESAYNIAAGTIGKDVTQTDGQGDARQMPWYERGLRVTGGIFGARQTINTEIAAPNSITNRAVDKLDDIFKNPPTIKPQSEFITPEGFRIKAAANPSELDGIEKAGNTFEMRAKKTLSGVAPEEAGCQRSEN